MLLIWLQFLEAAKEKVFDKQLKGLVRGIYWMEEYRLVEELSSYQVDPVQLGFHDNRS